MSAHVRGAGVAVAGALLALATACAPARLALPSGAGEPLAPEEVTRAAAALHGCAGLRTLTAELGLSGRAGSQRLRGRLIAGLEAPGSIRLEGVAPFGAPVFILAASPAGSTLLLPRDDRVLVGAPPGEILQALAGVALGPDDLLAALAGCPSLDPKIDGGRRYGDAWIVLAQPDAAEIYLRRLGTSWQPAAIVREGMTIEYSDFAGLRPGLVRLVSREGGAGAFDLRVRVSQVELNAPVPEGAFRVAVPPDALPMSIDELRDAGPMRDAGEPSGQ